jgi:hypothetical protein
LTLHAEHQAALVKQVKVNPTTGELEATADLDLIFRSKGLLASVSVVAGAVAEFEAIAAKAVLGAKEASAKH